MPRPACGAAPPRWHTTWPILPHRHASPPPPSDTTGTSKTPCTTRVTLPSRKINPASVITLASSHGCAASPTMCYAVTEPAPSVRTDTPPPSPDSMLWPSGASVESIEQPWDSKEGVDEGMCLLIPQYRWWFHYHSQRRQVRRAFE